jgi:aldose 1-epimerase
MKENSLTVCKKSFGVLADGTEINLYTVDNGDMAFSAMDYGCIITGIIAPGADKKDDVTLGFSSLDSWERRNSPFFGSFVGRYANRIRLAAFKLNGKDYRLDANDGQNCLHGGFSGYQSRPWHSEIYSEGDWRGVKFFGRSPSGDQGFPGNVDIEVFYLLNTKNELLMRYTACTDEDTPISLTNHTYFNLAGHKSGNIGNHVFQTHGDAKLLDVDSALLPTGKILEVDATVFDFSKPKSIGACFGHNELKKTGGGIDHCFCWPKINDAFDAEKLPLRVTVTEPKAGRKMIVKSNQPCCQLYTGNMLDPTIGKDGFTYNKHGAFCLETAQYNDAPNMAQFPQAILRPGELYDSATIYAFSKI